MLTLSSIELKNFRAFRSLPPLQLWPLTFLVGPNNAGKTSLLHSVMLLSQSGTPHFQKIEPVWTGGLVDLGSFEDAVWKHHRGSPIIVTVEVRDSSYTKGSMPQLKYGPPARFSYCFKARSGPIGYLSSAHIEDVRSGFTADLSRLRGRRPTYSVAIGRRRHKWSAATSEAAVEMWSTSLGYFVGKRLRLEARAARKGLKLAARRVANIADWYAAWITSAHRVASGRAAPERWYSRQEVDAAAVWREQRLFSEVNPRILERIEYWRRGPRTVQPEDVLAAGLERLGIARGIWEEDLSAYHSSIIMSDYFTRTEGKIVDFGYGASQVLPVLRAIASPERGPLFVEQPEIHLHPKAQAAVGRMLVETSKLRQVFVETHSEHLTLLRHEKQKTPIIPITWKDAE